MTTLITVTIIIKPSKDYKLTFQFDFGLLLIRKHIQIRKQIVCIVHFCIFSFLAEPHLEKTCLLEHAQKTGQHRFDTEEV